VAELNCYAIYSTNMLTILSFQILDLPGCGIRNIVIFHIKRGASKGLSFSFD
jgi:hypothetical protein